MSRLLESIKLLDGKFYNLPAHQQRMKRSLQALYGAGSPPELEQYLYQTPFPERGLYKCRVVYDQLSLEVSFLPYAPRVIDRIKVIEDNTIDYAFKFVARDAIDRLYSERGDCDDVLIVKNGKVTDCSFSNIVFRKGRQWFTPDLPLLEGTMRQRLLDEKIIQSREIRTSDIRSFDTFRIINAMLEFESPEIEVSAIVF